MLAESFIEKKKYNEAIDALTKAIEISKESESFLLKRAECYIEISDYDNALSDAVHLSRLNPSSIDAHYIRGLANYHTGEYSSAIDSFKKALKIDPEDKKVINAQKKVKKVKTAMEKGNEAYANNQFATAFTEYDTAAQLNSKIGEDPKLLEKMCKSLLEVRFFPLFSLFSLFPFLFTFIN